MRQFANISRTPTLTQALLVWTLGALLLVWGSMIFFAWRTGMHEADELTDGQLASVAALLLNLRVGESVPAAELTPISAGPNLRRHDYQQSLAFVLWDASGQMVMQFGDAPLPVFEQAEGFSDQLLGRPPKPWRSFAQWDTGRQRKLVVMLSEEDRDDLARDIALQIAEPGLWLLPVVMLVLGFAVRRGLRPMYRLSEEVKGLDAGGALRLSEPQSLREFEAVVASINGLLDQQELVIKRERELASEVAHELRTPLASMALNARSLRGELSQGERERALDRIEADAMRAAHVLSQLLALARADSDEIRRRATSVDLGQMVRRVVGEYAREAWSSGHELAVAVTTEVRVNANEGLLEIALRNLVENVMRHTPAGTQAEIRVGSDADGTWIKVLDNGPAVQPELSKRAAGGLGLGHKIIDRVARAQGARFQACAADPPFTTGFVLVFPGARKVPS